MIKQLHLKNFKCFTEQQFEFSPLTVFCGSNSAGKSTAIQSLLSIIQNSDAMANGKFRLDGKLFSFGKLKDLLSHHPVDNEIIIKTDSFSVTLIADDLNSKECLIQDGHITDLGYLTSLLKNDFVYLCAERFGPRSSFEIGTREDTLEMGIFGEFALANYHKYQDKPAPNQAFARVICSHLFTEHDATTQVVYTDALVREAMNRVCPGFSMQVNEAEEIDRIYNLYTAGSENIRPINVGFGVSYVLPIIISAALIRPGGTLIVENPEVHLHPRAQSSLVQILCTLSQTGVQVIIETHSDHIINGIRVFAKDHSFDERENIIHSVTDKEGKRQVKPIHIDKDGNLTAVDEGFFDQITKDLMRLF